MLLCGRLSFVILILHAGKCQEFRLFATDYQGKIYSLNATGVLVDTFDIHPHASGIAVDSFPHDDGHTPTIVYGTDKAIYRLALNGSETEYLYGPFKHLTERIVIEPMTRNIYYTASVEDKVNSSFIAVLSPQGVNTPILTDLGSPRGLALHPQRRQLFWTDWGSLPHIGSSNLDGSDRRVIVSSDLSWPNGLVIDFRDNLLYWCDGRLERIERSDLSGESREMVLHVPGVHLMSLLIDDGFLYITNWNAAQITRLSLASTTDNELFANITGGNRLIAMAVYPNSNLLALNCPQLKIPKHAILNDTVVTQGTVVSINCTKGYSLVGSKTLVCMPYGFWNSDLPVCKKDCTPFNKRPGFVLSAIASRHGSTVEADCDAGYYLVGESSVSCYDGFWKPTEPVCRKITPVIKHCPKEEDGWGTIWERAFPEQTITLRCNETGSRGNVTRKCTSEGKWLLPMYNCLRPNVRRLVEQIKSVKTNPSSSGVSQLLQDLANVTASHMDDNNLYSGEIESVTEVLESLANVSNNELNVTEDQSKLLLRAASNVIDMSYQHSWQVLSQTQGSRGAADVLRSVDTMAVAMARSLALHNSTWTTVTEENIVLKVSKVLPSQRDIKFPDSSPRKDWLNDTQTGLSAVLKQNSGSERDSYSAAIYRTFDGLMPSNMPPRSNNNKRTGNIKNLNTHILSLQYISNRSLLSTSVVLKFEHKKSNYTSPECSYWDLSRHRWETSGCQVKSSNNTATICECNHLTNFAVLMSPWTQASVDSKALEVISVIGCSVSVICLILTAVGHLILWRYIKSDRGVILINICFALTASYIIFLAGVNQTENEEACTAVAILLQYIYLVVFCLMLAEGLEIVMTVLYVFASKTRIKWTLPLAWGLPAVVVGISMGVTKLEGYGTEYFCWLSLDNGLIWAFVGPALVIIAANAVILMLVVRTMCRTKAFGEKTEVEKIKCSLRCLGVLLPIMGCTWILGILYVNNRTAWIQYVFAICNGLQGFFIFLFHVCLNKQLHVAVKRRRKLYKDSVSTTNTMTSKARPTIRKTSLFSSPRKPGSDPVRLIAMGKTVIEDSDDCSGQQLKTADDSALCTW